VWKFSVTTTGTIPDERRHVKPRLARAGMIDALACITAGAAHRRRRGRSRRCAEDVTATVFRLLGKTQPSSMTGRALDVGVRMSRFPLSEVSARLEAEPEPDADDE
jgi:hypothetical protein